MAVAHLDFNASTPHGSILRRTLTNLERGLEELNDCIATIQLMIDGNGSDASHFVYAAGKFGFPSDGAAMKAAWEELNSLAFKLNTNASVTDVNAAMLQAFNKLR
jgi:tetrahydromethanopterin S-methyltransferase subunit H